tara:strand:+ start:112 stop:1473 length:1362 start_codon:yes stop_codon:yes gene_type:complete
MRKLKSINPSNNEIIAEYSQYDASRVEKIILESQYAQDEWSQKSIDDRINIILGISDYLRNNLNSCAKLITLEMGKPISESILEVEKCITLCKYYAKNGRQFLNNEELEFDSKKSLIVFDPLGVILGIMPWNFPFWQVFRFAIPALIAGNTVIVKHASNVQGTSKLLHDIFNSYYKNIFSSLIISPTLIPDIIKNQIIKAVSFTGSDLAGSKVAKCSGQYIKKTVLELGGSDPFIVFKDVDINKCIQDAITSRMINNGQSCIAAKRFIIHKDIHNEFISKLKVEVSKLVIGCPQNHKTQIGPLATENILLDLEKQIKNSKDLGASIILGGFRLDRPGYYYSPTIMTNVKSNMPIYYEETFGPLFSIIRSESDEQMIDIANDSDFGLGSSIWTKDEEKAIAIANKIKSGSVFINGFTRSDPKLPFGGIKKSGYGKELSKDGIREFVNSKTIIIY